MQVKPLVEVCLDSVESAIAAERGGAARVELCDNLIEGGTTPSAGAIEVARKSISIGLQVMIRPRGGDFLYTDIEFEVMKADVAMAKRLGANGVVFGLLLPNGQIDSARSKILCELARPLSVTFHRAFDMSRDPFEALEALITLGVSRILTSGQEPTVLEGLDLITELNQRAGDRIIILPGCGINARNVQKIVETSKVKEIHVVGNSGIESGMQYRNARCYMGTELRSAEYTRVQTDAREIGKIIGSIG